MRELVMRLMRQTKKLHRKNGREKSAHSIYAKEERENKKISMHNNFRLNL